MREVAMGWWKIDPTTGMPTMAYSKISTPEMGCLNAVPGIDDEENAHYMGDAPWDYVSTIIPELESLFKGQKYPPLEQLLALFLEDVLPPSFEKLNQEDVQKFRKSLQDFWKDLDSLYQEEWGRLPRPAEKLWTCHETLKQLANGEYHSMREE